MPRWGRGWEVGVNKAIYEHERIERQAQAMITAEHLVKHDLSEREDLCLICKEEARKERVRKGLR